MTHEATEGVKLARWQVQVFAALLGSAILAGVGNYLSFRDWRVKTDLTLEQIKSATSLPRSEYEVERRYLLQDIEQLKVRVQALENR